MANMAFTFLPNVADGGLMILVHTSRPPNDAEWGAYYAEVLKQDPKRLKSLAFTDGGAPNGAQRKQINDYLGGQSTLGCVVTSSAMVRGVVRSLSWFNAQIKAFSPHEVDAALAYLGVRPHELAGVRAEIQHLRVKLGEKDLKSILVT